MSWGSARRLLVMAGVSAAALALGVPTARAQQADAAASGAARSPALGEQLRALAETGVISLAAGSAQELRALIATGVGLVSDGRSDQAVPVLLEALESPRFTKLRALPEYAAAEHVAAGALIDIGSLHSARRYLERVVARGPDSAHYARAVRELSDVALALGDLEQAAAWLATHEASMTEDARHELAYLRARAAFLGGASGRAAPLLERVGERSRFYGKAQYLLGVIAARDARFRAAEQRFCAVAGAGGRFVEVQDLARLGLGRTAHETRRGGDALNYYLQVPRESPRLADALFEAAYASYEAEEHDSAVDLLDRLAAHASGSGFGHEAAVLRGYVSLARCEFEQADREFERFIERYRSLVAYIDRLLANPARREQLYGALVAGRDGRAAESAMKRSLLPLLRLDPEFYRLHEQVSALDAEAARAGHGALAMDAVLARASDAGERRVTALEQRDAPALAALDRDLSLARLGVGAFSAELDVLAGASHDREQIAERERELSKIAERLLSLEHRAFMLGAELQGRGFAASPAGKQVSSVPASDMARPKGLSARVTELRAKLVRAASERAEAAVRALRDRLSGLLRRARIGRIDAVMGSKRRIEQQIESLAAGRFPPELRDPLRVHGLLEDDEEYWPFEGEDWPDEYEEHYDAQPHDPRRDRAAPRSADRDSPR